MIDDLAAVTGIFLKYGVYLFIITIAVGLVVGVFRKLRDEPAMFFKLLLVTITPLVAAIGFPYFVLYKIFDFPFFLNLVVGFVIYGLVTGFFDRRVHVKFKDE